jgi:pimeloyl-ACP methyl ester carboxylesterase
MPHLNAKNDIYASNLASRSRFMRLMKRLWMNPASAAFAILCMSVTVILLVFATWTQIIAWRATNAHPPLGIFVPVNGGKLHLRDIGPRDAPPERTLVLIHGASGNHLALLEPLQPLLEAHYRIIAIDRPGHGHSERVNGRDDASPTRQADLIAQAMLAIGVPRAIVLAHSFGGAVGTSLAMDHPERVAGLILLGPATHPWPGGIAWYYPIASHPIFGGLFSHILAVPGASLFMEAGLNEVFQPQIKPKNYEETTGLKLLLRPKNFMANAQDVAGLLAHVETRKGRYDRIKAPVTIISGERDKTVSTTIHSVPLANETGAKLIVLPDVGHMPHHADAGLVLRELNGMSESVSRLSKVD